MPTPAAPCADEPDAAPLTPGWSQALDGLAPEDTVACGVPILATGVVSCGSIDPT